MSPGFLKAALFYAQKLDWRVFPITPGKKSPPLLKDNLAVATTDPNRITEWWTKCPDANIGLAISKGLGVLDVDPRHGGDQNLTDLEMEYGPLPATPEVLTPSGGKHLYFILPVGTALRNNNAGTIAAGIDFKTTGGYVLLPPSMVDGKQYTWETTSYPPIPGREGTVSLASVPPWVAARLSTKPGKATTATPEQIPEGSRNATLTSIAGKLRRAGLNAAEIRPALAAVNAIRCKPPLPDDEVVCIAQSVGKYPPGGLPDSGEWPHWTELPPEIPRVETLPPEFLPEPLRSYLADAAERVRLPLECFAGPALVAVAAVVGRQLTIRPEPWNPDFVVTPNLWGALVGVPGMLKTHCITAMAKPLRRLEAKAREEYEAEKPAQEARQTFIAAKIDAIKRSIKKDSNAIADQSQITVLLAEKEGTKTVERRYTTSDGTVEKLGELLAVNPRGLLVIRDELMGFIMGLDRPGREADRAFYLESWNGDGSFRVDRIGRGSLYIPALCLSIVGGIQPGRLRSYVADATNDQSGAQDGFLQRFQVLLWPDEVPEWRTDRTPPAVEPKHRVYDLFERLDRLAVPEAAPGECPVIGFTVSAQRLWDEWRTDLENRLRSGREPEAFSSHLAKYRSLAPTLALLLHLVERGGEVAAISETSLRLALAWCDYLETHARKVYAVELDPAPAAARRIVERIQDGAILDGESPRNVYRSGWSGLKRIETVRAGLLLLQQHGWIKLQKTESEGRPGEVIRLHPDLGDKR